MKLHAPVTRVFLVAAWCGLAALAGCSDEEKIYVSPDLVQVFDEADGVPVAGIKIVMMNPLTNLPIAGPLTTGVDGICRFGDRPTNPFRLLVFGGVDYRVYSLPDFWSWNKGDQATVAPGLLTRPVMPPARSKTSSPPVRVFEIKVNKVVPDSLPRIRGQVVMAGTGKPLGQVFVSLSLLPSGYQGGTAPSDDVTGGDGLFSVAQIPISINPETGNLEQIIPLLFTRHGFRPVSWKYDPPNGSENVDISGVTITMSPVQEEDTGSISGRLWRDTKAAVGVTVGLAVIGPPASDKGGAGLTGWAAVTDAEGQFMIGGLPAGTYLLQPGFPLADGVFFPGNAYNPQVAVGAGQAVEAEPLVVLHEIEPRSPGHGQALGSAPSSLHWSPVPGAESYEVRINRGVVGWSDTNSIELPGTLVIHPGYHKWSVRAFGSSGEIGATQIQAVFRLLEPPD